MRKEWLGIELHVNLSLYKGKTRIKTPSIYQNTIVTLFSFNKSKILIKQIIYNKNSTNTYNSNIHRQEKEKDIITTSNTRTDMHVYTNIIIEYDIYHRFTIFLILDILGCWLHHHGQRSPTPSLYKSMLTKDYCIFD